MSKSKSLLTVVFCLFLTSNLFAQQKKGLYLGTGLTRSFYQDAEYSTLVHNNIGINFRFGYQNQKEDRLWNTGLEVKGLIGTVKPGWLQYTIYPTLHFSYLRKIGEIKRGDFLLGGRVDLWDLNLIFNSSLGNNGAYYFASNNYYLKGEWKKQLNDKWKFDAGVSLLVFGFTKELISYAFSSPREMLENGEFHYQKTDETDPNNLKYYQPKTIGKYNRYSVSIGFTKNNRTRFSYDWEFTHFAQLKNKPLFFGNHNIKWTVYFGIAKVVKYHMGNNENDYYSENVDK